MKEALHLKAVRQKLTNSESQSRVTTTTIPLTIASGELDYTLCADSSLLSLNTIYATQNNQALDISPFILCMNSQKPRFISTMEI